MSRWVVLSVRVVVAWLLIGAMALVGISAVSAQSTMDPSLDSDGDGQHNGIDFDDDNDGVADNMDCAPFNSAYGLECPAPTSPPPDPTPSAPAPSPPAPTPTPVPVGNDDPDNDGDGIADHFDPDDDNDGITDEHDAAPFDPNVGTQPTPSIIDPGADNDGDGIENSHDPDDDNDGVQDDQDSHPFDPTRGEKPPPSIIDPDTDSDGDGIMNSHDPDDDNDGVVDEIDCAPFDPAVGECEEGDPTPATGDPDGTSGSRTARGGGGSSPFLVTRLPSTGTGVSSGNSADAVVIGLVVLTAMVWTVVAILAFAQRRRHIRR